VIRVQDLRAGYPTGFSRTWREVLTGVSFEVPRGSITGYLGVNGAGKTTTIKVLVGINRPSGGSVTIGDHPVGSDAAQRLIGYFPEAPFFYDGLNGLELLEFFARLSGVPQAERRKKAEAVLEEVGLGGSAEVPVKGYSKGMRQRLGLAQALVHDPELLVLDEPLDGLDPMGRLHLRGLIARQRERGRTVFFSSHVLSDVEAVSDQLVVLDGGQVAYEGSVEGLGGSDASVDVQFAAPAEARDELAKVAGVELGSRGDLCEALCPNAEVADRLVAAVIDKGGRIASLVPRRANLEEVFLERFGAGKGAGTSTPKAAGKES